MVANSDVDAVLAAVRERDYHKAVKWISNLTDGTDSNLVVLALFCVAHELQGLRNAVHWLHPDS